METKLENKIIIENKHRVLIDYFIALILLIVDFYLIFFTDSGYLLIVIYTFIVIYTIFRFYKCSNAVYSNKNEIIFHFNFIIKRSLCVDYLNIAEIFMHRSIGRIDYNNLRIKYKDKPSTEILFDGNTLEFEALKSTVIEKSIKLTLE
ncbi:MAG: hypothetical protein K1X49_00760 [Saprospiraceae bacterium]|jgi:uncharacterized membrane protein YdbT with pleckstrin-like domain|nr:hypothetical protein [Saprospiraceae bacterium]